MRQQFIPSGLRAVAQINAGIEPPDDFCRGVLEHSLRSTWKAQWRFRTTDPWTFVTDDNYKHCTYLDEFSATQAARYVRNRKLQS